MPDAVAIPVGEDRFAALRRVRDLHRPALRPGADVRGILRQPAKPRPGVSCSPRSRPRCSPRSWAVRIPAHGDLARQVWPPADAPFH